MKLVQDNFSEAARLLSKFSENEENIKKIYEAGEVLAHAFSGGNKVISCGNGGSMADAMHFAEELSGRFRGDRPSLPAIAISDPTYISCTVNDYGYECAFSRFLEGFGKAGDVLLAISTSGNSANVLKAAETARNKNMIVIALTGKDGGKLASICDIEIRAPFSEYADRTQEIHIKIIHSLIHVVENKLNFC